MNAEKRCPNCGFIMVQKGATAGKLLYHCKGCGSDIYEDISEDGLSAYAMQRAELLTRVSQSLLGCDVGQWDYLRRDIVDFIGHYEQAHQDIHLQMAIVACITKGFHTMDGEIYKQTKLIFKVTEKMYKAHLKAIKREGHGQIEDVAQYEENRVLYKKCRDEYRNTKLMWKIVLSVGKLVLRSGI